MVKKGKAIKIILPKNNAVDNPEGNSIIKKMILLPLLPKDKVNTGLNYIRNLINEKFPGNDTWQDYVNLYFQGYWMNIVTPNRFSVYKLLDRTNNRVETYHKDLNKNIGKKPSVKKIISKKKFLEIILLKKKLTLK